MGSKSIGYATDWFTSSIKISVGRLFGSSNLTEKFFLGPEVRGYRQLAISPVSHNKKVGGNSFISMRTQAGVFVGPVELFAFGDAGVTSVHGLQQCYEIVSAFADNNCLGKSIGCGVSLKNNKSISFIYSVPLTKNEEVENYTLTMDMKF
ncbi:hypothetical protein PAEPH01_2397 [Pancytospora epiphaga]|nr:hypothetical protein PAEPH01_2397 [Pancytospora epiphaga]